LFFLSWNWRISSFLCRKSQRYIIWLIIKYCISSAIPLWHNKIAGQLEKRRAIVEISRKDRNITKTTLIIQIYSPSSFRDSVRGTIPKSISLSLHFRHSTHVVVIAGITKFFVHHDLNSKETLIKLFWEEKKRRNFSRNKKDRQLNVNFLKVKYIPEAKLYPETTTFILTQRHLN